MVESDTQAVELRNRVIGHLDLAIQATPRAIALIEQGAWRPAGHGLR